MFDRVVYEYSLCQERIVMETISTIKFTKYDDISSRYFLTNCAKRTITVSIHGRESNNGFILCSKSFYPVHYIFFKSKITDSMGVILPDLYFSSTSSNFSLYTKASFGIFINSSMLYHSALSTSFGFHRGVPCVISPVKI